MLKVLTSYINGVQAIPWWTCAAIMSTFASILSRPGGPTDGWNRRALIRRRGSGNQEMQRRKTRFSVPSRSLQVTIACLRSSCAVCVKTQG